MSVISETRFLVLRKTPYGDTSLVLAGLSPTAGQVHVLVRGGRRLGRRQFPTADLFRELLLQYRPGRGDLGTWSGADVLEDFRAVARLPALFEAAAWLARFALANLPAGLPQPRAYAALLVALRRLATAPLAEPGRTLAVQAAACGLAIVCLDEHGLLPDYAAQPRLAEHRGRLLAMGEDGAPPPHLGQSDWPALRRWLLLRLEQADFRLPPPD